MREVHGDIDEEFWTYTMWVSLEGPGVWDRVEKVEVNIGVGRSGEVECDVRCDVSPVGSRDGGQSQNEHTQGTERYGCPISRRRSRTDWRGV